VERPRASAISLMVMTAFFIDARQEVQCNENNPFKAFGWPEI
jgi:hypothetical protein